MSDARIGISGWTYAPWRGVFFPAGLPQKRELTFAAEHVRTIEINGTFYSMQRPSSFGAWRDATPENFVFAVKGPRFITHIKRLKDCVAPLGNFFASGLLRLNEKLGPILWQLPPSMRFDPERLAAFLNMLPRTTREAAIFGRHHDRRLKARAWLRITGDRPLRHALEVRHASFESAEFVELLRRQGIALVVADTAGRWPRLMDVTADFVYVRLHGDRQLYASGYTAAALREWARRIDAWRAGGDAPGERLLAGRTERRKAGRDVFVYFDNDVKTHAPFDAMALARRLGGRPPELRRGAAVAPPPAVRTKWPGWRSRGKTVATKRTRGRR
ncbi:MAG TPA: DUF72 domain-containing protein [Opitutus sp.]|nr:DUF72 domain-containing protein [Opitutus sp.]